MTRHALVFFYLVGGATASAKPFVAHSVERTEFDAGFGFGW
jgi:hypothetical protein